MFIKTVQSRDIVVYQRYETHLAKLLGMFVDKYRDDLVTELGGAYYNRVVFPKLVRGALEEGLAYLGLDEEEEDPLRVYLSRRIVEAGHDREAAQEVVGVFCGTLESFLRELGDSQRKGIPDADELRAAYSTERNVTKLAKQYGVSRPTIYRWLRRHKIST